MTSLAWLVKWPDDLFHVHPLSTVSTSPQGRETLTHGVPADMSQEALSLPPGVQPPAHSMDITLVPDFIGPPHTSVASLKRRATSSPEDAESSTSRKKLREDMSGEVSATPEEPINGQVLADELEQELQCGCCAALVYRPVVVSPCQHFFCGRFVISCIIFRS